MPHTPIIPPSLIEQVKDGKAVLILGAGASAGALHPKKSPIPLGVKLGHLISDKFLGGEHRDDGLAVISEIAISETDLFSVQEFIRELFDQFMPGEFHKLITTFKWHGIASINYDLILERTYSGKCAQALRAITSNSDRIQDFIQSPSDLLLLKLHGCITKTRDEKLPLILTQDQYVTHRRHRGRLYQILKDWAHERPLVFIGMTLQDFDLRKLLIEIVEDAPSRPRYYFVTPTVTKPMQRLWESKSVTMLPMTFETFLTKLDAGIPAIARAVPVTAPTLPVYERFETATPTLSVPARAFLEHDVEYVHIGQPTANIDPITFYRGGDLGWGPIIQNLDSPRDATDELLLEVFLDESRAAEPQVIAILGPAGVGKSVLMRRLAWEAASQLDATCIWVQDTGSLSIEILEEIIPQLRTHLYLFIDNAPDHARNLNVLCEKALKRNVPLTIIVTGRTNEWNMSCDELSRFVRQKVELGALSPSEVKKLLAVVEKHDALGTLSTASPTERIAAFTDYAQGNLLVALHEATLGLPFEKIVKDEYESVANVVARNLYLTVCVLNRSGTRVRAGLISRVHGVPFDKFREEFFEPLEHLVYSSQGRRGYDMEYRARHQHIAELVFQQVLGSPQERYEKYASIISALVLSYETDRQSFKQLMNAEALTKTISDRGLIEQLYTLAKELAPDDGHVYLQHGLFEMKGTAPNLDRTAAQFSTALEIMPNNWLVKHAMARLELKRAEADTRPLVREKHLQKAKALVAPMCGKHARSAHGFHTSFRVEVLRLRFILEDTDSQDEAITESIQLAERALDNGMQMFPEDSVMLAAESELADLLRDQARVLSALEAAVERSKHNSSLVGRLARHYENAKRFTDARDLLKEAIEVLPYERILHFKYAKLAMRLNEDASLIESHLKKSFSNGDRNYEAQYWYARQLYLNDKIDEAKDMFTTLKTARAAPRVRGHWKEGETLRSFGGTIARLDTNFGFITRDGSGDDVYTDRRNAPEDWWGSKAHGARVRFNIGFSFSGPVAVNIENE